MSGASLLTRLRRPELAVARRKISDSEIRESLLTHLQNMCRTRRGSMLTSADYGIPDVSEISHSLPDGIDELARALRSTIQRYEPRLTDVRVTHIPAETGDLLLRYQITGRVLIDGEERSMSFETMMDHTRRLSIT